MQKANRLDLLAVLKPTELASWLGMGKHGERGWVTPQCGFQPCTLEQ